MTNALKIAHDVGFYTIADMQPVLKTPLANAYFRFLQLARAVEALPEAALMDANEQALLEDVVQSLREVHGKALPQTKAPADGRGGSR